MHILDKIKLQVVEHKFVARHAEVQVGRPAEVGVEEARAAAHYPDVPAEHDAGGDFPVGIIRAVHVGAEPFGVEHDPGEGHETQVVEQEFVRLHPYGMPPQADAVVNGPQPVAQGAVREAHVQVGFVKMIAESHVGHDAACQPVVKLRVLVLKKTGLRHLQCRRRPDAPVKTAQPTVLFQQPVLEVFLLDALWLPCPGSSGGS